MDTLQDPNVHCQCVSEHRPPVLEYNVHHIQPLEFGGPNVASNKIAICPNTHTGVHKILRSFMKATKVLPRNAGEPKYAYNLAVEGFNKWDAAGRP